MTSLDKRLREILNNVATEAYEDRNVPITEAIEAIKTCFEADGWVKIPQTEVVTRYERGKKPEVFMVNGKEVMTGSEWRQAFERELNAPKDRIFFNMSDIINAAKRASGEDNE